MPQEAQRCLEEIDRDDVERARAAGLDDRFRFAPIKATPSDKDFGFVRLAILLALDDTASKDDVFEINDREVVIIFQFFGGVKGYDIVQRTNQIAYLGDRKSRLMVDSTGSRLGA